ncbi:MAG: polysaccharide deacetylase family protein [Verrucomicrobiales bacterium]|nr:polysaccharide deacetylase family protein [Verrucomicrobiales bacterium]
MRLVFSVALLALTLASCQKPGSISLSAPPASAPEEKRTPLKTLAVGLSGPTWEQTKEATAASVGETSLDDTYTRIKTSEQVISITFDDGPHPQNTPRLLDMLKERGIKATFFVVGDMVRHNPHLLRRMIAEGHEIGNHTVTHDTLSRMNDRALKAEMSAAHQQILAATGVPPRCMRPPGGAIKKDQKQFLLREFGYPTILWSCDPKDWQRPGVEVVTQRLLDGAYPGGILLVHDLHKPTVDAMPKTLDVLLSRGYRFVTISELIAMDES